MKLMTKAIAKTLPKLHTGNGIARLKFFGGSCSTWLIVEGEPDGEDYRFYGFCAPQGLERGEWGEVMLSDLMSCRFPPFGLPVERDRWFKPTKVSELLKP